MLTLTVIFLTAWLLDLLFGDPRTAWHPVALFGRLAGRVEAGCRQLPCDAARQGLAAWLLLVIPAGSVAGLAVAVAGRWSAPAAALLAGGFLYFAIAVRSLIGHGAAIRAPLERGDLPAARRALGLIVSRDTAALAESEIVRGGIESLGENLVDAVNSAFFWAAAGFLLGGAPGAAAAAVMLRAGNTLDACWGYRNERYQRFGRAAARLDDALNFLPARLSLPVIAFAACFIGGSARAALCAGWRHRCDHPSPNSAWSMAAFAGALQIRLGGPTVYGGEVAAYPYYGDGRSALTAADLRRAERLVAASALLFTLFCLLGAWLCLRVR